MAPGSPSAIQAFSDRPLPERSEAKNSDGSDGQFADLMAQITRAPKAAKAPEPPARPPRQEKGPRTPAAKTQTSPAPEAPTAPVEASPSAVGPKDSTAQVLPSGADGASSVADAKNAQVDPVEPGTPLKADSSPDDAPAAQASVLASLRPLDTLRPLEAVPAKAAAQILTPGDPTTPTAGIPSTNPSNAPIAGALPTTPSSTPAIPVQPQALPPVGEGGATSRGASDPGSLQIQAGATPPPDPQPASPNSPQLASQNSPQPASQNSPQPAPQGDPLQPKAQALGQAAIAELASQVRTGPKPGGGGLSSDTTATNAPPVVKSMQTADAQALSLQRVEAQTDPLPAGPGSTGSLGEDKSGPPLPSANPEAALPTLEVLAARSTIQTPTPAAHGPDGSALVATGLLPRPGEPLTVSPPATPQAPTAQPSAPVLQVEGGLRWMLKGGAQEAQLQLHPDSLGQVTIHLKVEGSEVHARMWISEPGSVQAVQEGRPHLEMALKEQGLQLGSFDLQQGQQPFQEAPTASPLREPSFPEVAPARQEAPAAPSPSILNSHHVELYV